VIQGFRFEEALMRKQLCWLSDAEWDRLEPLLPRGRRGAHRVDDRRVISGNAYAALGCALARLSEPPTPLERLQLMAARLLQRPVAIVPHPCKTTDEWMERYGGLAEG
jgi:hypothetical protein